MVSTSFGTVANSYLFVLKKEKKVYAGNNRCLELHLRNRLAAVLLLLFVVTKVENCHFVLSI